MKKHSELTIVQDGSAVAGEVVTVNESIRGMLISHSVSMEKKIMALQAALEARERKMDLALERLTMWNDGLDESLAEQFSREG